MRDFTIDVDLDDDYVATVTYARGSNNFFSEPLISELADTFEKLADEGQARAILLSGAGKHFCAGADFTDGAKDSPDLAGKQKSAHLYDAAIRLFRQPLPIVAAIQGGAIGGGLGLAMACDFRVASPDARFSAPFAKLGLHHGFGLTVTLPLVIGHQRSLDLLYTARRITGEEAAALGLVDRLTQNGGALEGAHALAKEVAASAPIAVRSIRATMRGHLAEAVKSATDHEKAEQKLHSATADLAEGIRADLERRAPSFQNC